MYESLDGLKGDVNPIVRLKRLKKLFELLQKTPKLSGIIHSSQKVKNLQGKSFEQAKKDIELEGFKYNGKTEGGYDKFKHSDGSEIQIRPNGEVVRTQKVWTSDGSKKYPQRYDEEGNPTDSHNTGEFIIR